LGNRVPTPNTFTAIETCKPLHANRESTLKPATARLIQSGDSSGAFSTLPLFIINPSEIPRPLEVAGYFLGVFALNQTGPKVCTGDGTAHWIDIVRVFMASKACMSAIYLEKAPLRSMTREEMQQRRQVMRAIALTADP
jgi:hypothetical protein